MFLRSIELYGFKSFADRTRLEFASGTSSLLGPNGCGKSNIVDAIKWVLGEQSTKSLRAGKMEDVIFNGTEKRSALGLAEVSLVINNETSLLPTESSEVEIRRRLYRSGESEFFINRQQVRLKDIRELFFDTGVGKSAYSILEQGKIDQILSTRPEDRRYIFEEAAGITRYRIRSVEAARKLERTEENIEQVETLLKEIKRQYDSRKIQADRAHNYQQMKDELFSIDVAFNLHTVQSFLLLKEEKERLLENSLETYENLKEEIEERTDELERMRSALNEVTSERVSLTAQVHQLEEKKNGTYDRLDLLTQRYHDFLTQEKEAQQRAVQIQERIEREEEILEEHEERKESLEEYLDSLTAQRERNREQMRQADSLSASLETEIAATDTAITDSMEEHTSLLDEINAVSSQIVLDLEQQLSAHSYSKESRKEASDALVLKMKRMEEKLMALETLMRVSMEDSDALERILSELNDTLGEIRTSFTTFSSTYSEILDVLVSPQGSVSRKRKVDETLSLLKERQSSLRESLSLLKDERESVREQIETHRREETDLKVKEKEAEGRLEISKHSIETLLSQKHEREFALDDALHDQENASVRMAETMDKIEEVKEEQQSLDTSIAALKERVASIDLLTAEQSEEVNRVQRLQNEEYEQIHTLRSSHEKYRVQIDSLQEQISQVYHLFFETYGRTLREFETEDIPLDEDEDQLRERQKYLRSALEKMGYINHMAAQEFEEIRERYEFLKEQMEDLLNAKANLNSVIEEITTKSEQMFLETYQKIRLAFHQMFHRMFAGGRAELKLLDHEHPLSSGIEIYAQPPGKKLDRLAPLSGGEKSLTAVALLFATYSVKPSPFCILDEIDAALDDRNIGFFLDVLKDFSEKSQFIIITHNKHTVMGSQTLLGVTMQEKGVSKAVAYKMGWDEEGEVITDEKDDASYTAERTAQAD